MMDGNISGNYEFLDLTDIDDNEKRSLLYTLQKSHEESCSLNVTLDKSKKRHVKKNFNSSNRQLTNKYNNETKNTIKHVAENKTGQQIHNADAVAEGLDTRGHNKFGTTDIAQNTNMMHHQHQQQQLSNAQGQIQSQQTVVQQQSSQNNNINNYQGHHPHPHHGFNHIHPSGVYMQNHAGTPAMYHMVPTATLPGNVFVNNVTANVNLHGFVTHSVPQYIPASQAAFIHGDSQQNGTLGNEQPNQTVHTAMPVVSTRGSRRGRGRGSNNNSRRIEYNQRQQGSPAPEIVSNQIDAQNIGPTSYAPYFQFAYPPQFIPSPAQNISHAQAQQATGTPLIVANPLQFYPGSQTMYNCPQGYFYSTVMPQDYQMVDEKGEEQQPSEGIIQQIWPHPIQYGYQEEYLTPELVDEINHNTPSIQSVDTPSMLSPMIPLYETRIHSSLEVQQHMEGLHVYETASLSQQSLQSDEQILENECIETTVIEQEPDIIKSPIISEDTQNIEQNKSEDLNNDEFKLNEKLSNNSLELEPTKTIINHYVNNVDVQDKKENCILITKTEPKIISNSLFKENKDCEEKVAPVPNHCDQISTVNTICPLIKDSVEINETTFVPKMENKVMPKSDETNMKKDEIIHYGNILKKSTASVAVTAIPTPAKEQSFTFDTIELTTSNIPLKNNVITKLVPTSPTGINGTNVERKYNNQISISPSNDTTVRSVTTASIASSVVPHHLQDKRCSPQNDGKKLQETNNTIIVNKDTDNNTTDIRKTKKEEITIQNSTNSGNAPLSWASLFENKTNSTYSSTIAESNATSHINSFNTKRPVAKVLPFEGTSTTIQQIKTPGALSYSAASLQGCLSDDTQKNINKNKTTAAISPSVLTAKSLTDVWSTKFADFLLKYKIDYAPISLKPRGLTNPSNYCYINSILQALVACSPFYNLIKSITKLPVAASNEKINTPTLNAMIQLVSQFSHLPSGIKIIRRDKGCTKKDDGSELTCDPAFEPSNIYKLWNATRADVEGRQEDAEEFLGYVLNKLNDEMLEVMKLNEKSITTEVNSDVDDGGDDWQMIYNNRNKGGVTRQTNFGKTPVSDIFRGELRSRLQRDGEGSTNTIQPFYTLQLNIEKAASVKEALEILVGKDQLEGVTGSKTNQEVTAWQQMTLEKLPVILILHLKWFDYKQEGCTKIFKTVEFPIELKIDPKILGLKKYSQKQRLYRLFAVVYHDGKEATKGHYITDVYHSGYACWLRFDDSTVKPVSENFVLRPRALRVPYLLYYRRCDTILSTQQGLTNK